MKRLVAMALVILTVAALAGTASAKARGEYVWSMPTKAQANGLNK